MEKVIKMRGDLDGTNKVLKLMVDKNLTEDDIKLILENMELKENSNNIKYQAWGGSRPV